METQGLLKIHMLLSYFLNKLYTAALFLLGSSRVDLKDPWDLWNLWGQCNQTHYLVKFTSSNYHAKAAYKYFIK